MIVIPRNLLCAAAMAALLASAAGCAAPTADANGLTEDGAANHPITVEPSYRSLKVNYAPGAPDMALADAANFDTFVAGYEEHGNGSVEVSIPNGPGARAAIAFFAERLAKAGVPRDKILVSTHDAPGDDYRIEINYIAYEAHAAPCGDWSDDLAFTQDNTTPKNFGCSVQHNLAAMVADPRDLIAPRASEPADTARRATVMGHYENGDPTAATKRTGDLPVEQSAPGSDVGKE